MLLGTCVQAVAGADPLSIIDMHLHAMAADEQGPPPVVICAPYDSMPIRAASASVEECLLSFFKTANCAHPIWSAKDNDNLREESLAALQRYNMIAVTSGEPQFVQKWHAAEPKRIIPAIMFGIHDAPSIASLRAMYKAGMLKVMGEIVAQYEGVGPNDSRLEPYFRLAEELDVPVGIHVGPGPPGAAYLGMAKYRASLSDALPLEDVLVKHPRLRLYVCMRWIGAEPQRSAATVGFVRVAVRLQLNHHPININISRLHDIVCVFYVSTVQGERAVF